MDTIYFRVCAGICFVLDSICSLTSVLLSGKKVQIRKPAPAQTDIAPLRRSSRPVIISSSALKKNTAQHRPLRERLLHLLALKPYKKPELILRLQKDGLQQSDKDCLNSHLQQVRHAFCISRPTSSRHAVAFLPEHADPLLFLRWQT